MEQNLCNHILTADTDMDQRTYELTVAKHFEMIRKMLGIQETTPRPLLDCQTVPLVV